MDWQSLRISLTGREPPSLIPPRVKLPILPLAVTKFSQRAGDPNATARELGEIIATDTGLTCDLLRYVNSSARGMSQKAKSAQQAVALLGITESRLYLLTQAVERALRGRESKLIDLRLFAANNLERALFARHIAELLRTDSEIAFAAAMLVDFILPALTTDLFPKYYPFLQEQRTRPTELYRFERKALDWDHAEAAAQVMYRWGFPDELICCVRLHHGGLNVLNDRRFGRTPIAAVAVSALMPDAFGQSANGLAQLISLNEKWPRFDLLTAAEEVEREYQELVPIKCSNRVPFVRLCREAMSLA